MASIQEWLQSIGLDEYAEQFIEARITPDLLPDLTEADLEKLGLPLGDRKRVLRAIAARAAPTESDADARPPAAGQHLPSAPDPVQLRQLTVAFIDLVGSTAFSARLDLEDYKDLLRTYHMACTRVINAHGGFVSQYAGDGVIAYFGYPRAQEDDPEQAVLAGLAAIREVAKIPAAGGGSLTARVGVATGQVVIDSLDYEGTGMTPSAMGEIPNLAARLQSLAEPGQVLVSATTRRLLGNEFVCEDAGSRELKGFAERLQVFRVHEVKRSVSRFEARQRGSWTPFVNRDEERALLLRRWAQACTSEGNVVLLSGEPGIGKSRLARELAGQAATEAPLRLHFQCSAHHTQSALFPVIAHLEHAARIGSDDTPKERLAKLRELLAGAPDDLRNLNHFARLLSVRDDDANDDGQASGAVSRHRREEMLQAMVNRMLGLASTRPLLIIFEDLHWIDPTSQELLDLLVERLSDRRILLICTFRQEYSPPWAGLAHVTRLDVNRLNPKEAAVIVTRIAAGRGQSVAALDAIVEKTDGVPLFIEELTKAAMEAASGPAGRRGPADPLALPSTLKDSLMSRLDRLPLAEKVMPVGAAIGRQFSHRVLAAVTGLDDTVLVPALTQLVDAELLFQRGEPPDAVYTFKHALVQDVAYESVLKSRMRDLHARIAATIEEQFPQVLESRPEVAAGHFTRARLHKRALHYWEQAAEKAIARSANAEAVSHVQSALKELDHEPDRAIRDRHEIRLREMLREPIELCGWGSDAIEQNLRRLYELSEHEGDVDEQFAVVYGSCGSHLLAGRVGQAESCTERMAQLAAETGDPAHEIVTLHTRALLAFLAGRFDEAVNGFDREISMLTPEHAAAMRRHYVADANIVARVMQAWALSLSGASARAESRIAEAERLIEAQEQSFSRIYGLTIIASIRQTCGQPQAALELAREAWQTAHAEHVPYWEAWAEVVLGWATTATGDAGAGLDFMRKGLADYAQTGARQMLPYGQVLLADACLKAGLVREGLSVIEQLEQQDATNEIRFFDRERHKIAEALRAAATVGGAGP